MAKKQSSKTAKPLPPLRGVGKQVLDFVMNNVALTSYGECCSVEGIAEHLGRTPGRFLPTLRKLAEQGYITIEGDTYPWVYPTVAALEQQDKTLTQKQAEAILARLRA